MIEIDNDLRHSAIKFTNIKVGEIKTGKVIDFEESTLVSPVDVKFERMLVTDFYK